MAPVDPTPRDDVRRDLLDAMAVLRDVIAAPDMLEALDAEERAAFRNAAGDVFCPDPEIRRRRTKALQLQRRRARTKHDEDILEETGIRTLRRRPVFATPDVFPPKAFEQDDVADDPDAPPFRETLEPQHCYICKASYREVHHFYDQLCGPCATLNHAKRGELADMRGMVALLTGGRVKIGYQAGIKLLRSGAELIVATRFPRDAARRYAAEADFEDWGHRLEVFGLDLRHTPSVEAFLPTCSAPAPAWTPSSTTRARPSAGHPASTSTCSRVSGRRSPPSRRRSCSSSGPTRPSGAALPRSATAHRRTGWRRGRRPASWPA